MIDDRHGLALFIDDESEIVEGLRAEGHPAVTAVDLGDATIGQLRRLRQHRSWCQPDSRAPSAREGVKPSPELAEVQGWVNVARGGFPSDMCVCDPKLPGWMSLRGDTVYS